jgi:D-alanyl-D-alanine carboxypeptidase (penicillin-binding protein 5/6)
MNTRRVLLLAGTAVASLSAMPAWAKRHHAAPASAASGGDEGGPGASTPVVSSPADTPIGPVDTVATHAIVIDFNTGAADQGRG